MNATLIGWFYFFNFFFCFLCLDGQVLLQDFGHCKCANLLLAKDLQRLFAGSCTFSPSQRRKLFWQPQNVSEFRNHIDINIFKETLNKITLIYFCSFSHLKSCLYLCLCLGQVWVKLKRVNAARGISLIFVNTN